MNLTTLSKQIGYDFADAALLEQALTHRSRNKKNYERLEFLGDSILSFAVSRWLYGQFPSVGEGMLSRMRANIVCKESLAKVARALNIGDFLRLGEGEMKSDGFNRDSILSDAVEGIIGAIYIDSNLENSIAFIDTFFSDHLSELQADTIYKDSKSQLQEHLQKRGFNLPVYTVVETTGEPHDQHFKICCDLSDLERQFYAEGNSRKVAEQKAAKLALQDIL